MDIFLKVMDKYESVRHFLGFEIGAADFYSSPNNMESMIHMLHDLGSSVSLDGLGGDTLLISQLEIPPVDMVKFHRHFLLTGMKNANNRILFEKMAEMAPQIPFMSDQELKYLMSVIFPSCVKESRLQKKLILCRNVAFLICRDSTMDALFLLISLRKNI